MSFSRSKAVLTSSTSPRKLNQRVRVDILIPMDEVIVVNEDGIVIGTMPKDQAHRDGTLHRISVIYVENTKGDILVQRRDDLLDHSSAGHVYVGESYEQASYRELKEELGIQDVVLQHVGHGMTKDEAYPNGTRCSHIFDVFSCVAEPKELQADEVSGVYWAQPEEVLADMKIHADKYCGGFLVSLPIYLESKKSRDPSVI